MATIESLLDAFQTRAVPLPQDTASIMRADFADPDALLAAVGAVRAKGLTVVDTFTPFPVHGMDEALGEKASRLPWITGILGLAGFSGAFALQYWTSVVDYPLVVGGKPLNSLPAFIPVLFELTVLLAGLGSVAAFFAIARMRPRLRVPDLHQGVNDDRFVMVLELKRSHTFEPMTAELSALGAVATERLVTDARSGTGVGLLDRELSLPASLGAILLPPALVLGAGLAINRDFTRRVVEFDAGMLYPLAAQAYDPSPVLPHGQVLQAPPEGTVAKGQAPPLAYVAGKEEAVRAGVQLKNPLTATPGNMARGAVVWNRVCATCHGPGGKGDGGVIPHFPNPPNLMIPKYFEYQEGRIFHVATFGGPEKIMKGLADQLSAEDRWRAVMHLKSLQAEAVKSAAATSATPPAALPAPATGAAPARFSPSIPAPNPAPAVQGGLP